MILCDYWRGLKVYSVIYVKSLKTVEYNCNRMLCLGSASFPPFHKFLKDDEKIFSLEKYVTLTVLTWRKTFHESDNILSITVSIPLKSSFLSSCAF